VREQLERRFGMAVESRRRQTARSTRSDREAANRDVVTGEAVLDRHFQGIPGRDDQFVGNMQYRNDLDG
jgi:hypothetical protein